MRYELKFETPVKMSLQEIIPKFNQDLFEDLAPPLIPFQVERFDGCNKGDEVHLVMGFPPLKQKWVSHITESHTTDEEFLFVDEGALLPFPLTAWKHIHIVRKTSSGSVLVDDISFTCSRILAPLLKIGLKCYFSMRQQRYRKAFGRQ